MSMSPFCKACGQRVEWHPTVNGRQMPIDPDPHPDGRFAFDGRMKLGTQPKGSRPRMYRCHFDTCPKGGQEPRRAAFVCDWREPCDHTEPHRHCYRCGGIDHFASECDAQPESW